MSEKPKEIETKDIQKMDIFTCLDKMQSCIDVVSKTYGKLLTGDAKSCHNKLVENMTGYNAIIRDFVLEIAATVHLSNNCVDSSFDGNIYTVFKNFKYLWLTKFESVFKEKCKCITSSFNPSNFDEFEIHSSLYHTKHTINLKKVDRFPSSIVDDNSIIANKFTKVSSFSNIEDAIYELHRYAVKTPGLTFIVAKNRLTGEEVCPVATIFNRSGKDFKYLINKEDK